MKELIKNTIVNLVLLMFSSLTLSYLLFNWFDSITISLLSFIGFWVLVFIYPKGGRNVRRNAVDSIRDKLIEQKEVRSLAEMSDWLRGVGALLDTSQPMWVKESEEGIYLFYLCYRRKPPFLLPWERVFNIQVIRDSGVSYAKLSLNHFNGNFVIPWNESFEIPKSVKKI